MRFDVEDRALYTCFGFGGSDDAESLSNRPPLELNFSPYRNSLSGCLTKSLAQLCMVF